MKFSFISFALTGETKPSTVASLSSEDIELSENKGKDWKLCFEISHPKRTFHETVFFLCLEIVKITVKQYRNRKMLGFSFSEVFVMKYLVPTVVLVGEMPQICKSSCYRANTKISYMTYPK